MSTSTDGGLTWGPVRDTANHDTGLGSQPLVQPGGKVIVPIADAFENAILAFTSSDGGATWSGTVLVANVSDHQVAGNLRTGPLPSAEMDSSGKAFVVWQDCRFRANCAANDIVMSTSSNGTSWSAVTRIPIDAVTSTIDHFIPGIGVGRVVPSTSAHLGLSYYYYPNTACTTATCQLNIGYVSSADDGATWSAPTALDPFGARAIAWLRATSQGHMVGDYISTSVSNGFGHPVFALVIAPSSGTFHEGMFTPANGLSLTGGNIRAGAEQPIPVAASDHAKPRTPLTLR